MVIGIASERTANPKQTVLEYSEKAGINYVNFITNNRDVYASLTRTYGGIEAVPTTYLVSKDNTIFEKIVGARTKEQFEASIIKMIK